MQPSEIAKMWRAGIVPSVGGDLATRPQGLIVATSGGPSAPMRTYRPQPDQAKVPRAVRERLTPPAVVAAVANEEEVGHVIVTKAKEVAEAGSATMV